MACLVARRVHEQDFCVRQSVITFVSLLLGLVLGPHEIEIAVSGPIERVELVLDGEIRATWLGPPWKATVDLGAELVPHRLEAVGYDGEGTEIARAVQLLNLPRPQSEVSLALELDPAGQTSTFDVHWSTVLGVAPREVEAFFDGRPLEADRFAAIALPPYDPRQLHFLQVEVAFSETQVATAEATFGGIYADTVSSELTAVVLRPRDSDRGGRSGRRASTIGVDSTLLVAGEERSPEVVERGSGEFVVLRDLGARSDLELLAGGGLRRSVFTELGDAEILRLVGSVPELRRGPQGESWLFPTSGELEAGDGRLTRLLAFVGWPEEGTPRRPQQLFPALAIAGVTAVSLDRRRIVVLVLGRPTEAVSDISSAERVRGYLAALGVPLQVWTTAPNEWAATEHGWGELVDVSRPSRLQRAVRAARQELEQQTVAWFSGAFLPQEFAAPEGAPYEVAR